MNSFLSFLLVLAAVAHHGSCCPNTDSLKQAIQSQNAVLVSELKAIEGLQQSPAIWGIVQNNTDVLVMLQKLRKVNLEQVAPIGHNALKPLMHINGQIMALLSDSDEWEFLKMGCQASATVPYPDNGTMTCNCAPATAGGPKTQAQFSKIKPLDKSCDVTKCACDQGNTDPKSPKEFYYHDFVEQVVKCLFKGL